MGNPDTICGHNISRDNKSEFKTHTIRKVKFLSKNSILTKPQHFHEFFTQKIDNIHEKSKLKYRKKNEDFEQCVKERQQKNVFFFCA